MQRRCLNFIVISVPWQICKCCTVRRRLKIVIISCTGTQSTAWLHIKGRNMNRVINLWKCLLLLWLLQYVCVLEKPVQNLKNVSDSCVQYSYRDASKQDYHVLVCFGVEVWWGRLWVGVVVTELDEGWWVPQCSSLLTLAILCLCARDNVAYYWGSNYPPPSHYILDRPWEWGGGGSWS